MNEEYRMWYAGGTAYIINVQDEWRVFWVANGIRFSSVPYPDPLSAQRAVLGVDGYGLTIDTEMDMDYNKFREEQKRMDLSKGMEIAKDMAELNPHYTHELTLDVMAEMYAFGVDNGRQNNTQY